MLRLTGLILVLTLVVFFVVIGTPRCPFAGSVHSAATLGPVCSNPSMCVWLVGSTHVTLAVARHHMTNKTQAAALAPPP
jgi:hypothetical protein